MVSQKEYIAKKHFNDTLLKKYGELTKKTFAKVIQKLCKNDSNDDDDHIHAGCNKEEAEDSVDQQKQQKLRRRERRFVDSDESE